MKIPSIILLAKILLIYSYNITKCDFNCAICDNISGKCIKCKNNYSLINNKCKSNKRSLYRCDVKNCYKCHSSFSTWCEKCNFGYHLDNFKNCQKDNPCPISHCKDCSDDGTICYECEFFQELKNGKCFSRGIDCKSIGNNCEYCYERTCYKCYFKDYFGPIDSCKNSIDDNESVGIIIGCIFGALFFICIIGVPIYIFCKKKIHNNNINTNINNNITRNFVNYNNNNNNNRVLPPRQITVQNNNNINNIVVEHNTVRSEENLLNINREFDIQKEALEKEYDFCDYCKFNPAKYKSDCGCILCKEHSKLNNEKPNHFCINCEKEVNNIELMNECNICLEEKEDLGHFKCGCAFKVCKDCYFNIKKKDNKCPACRGQI